MAGQLDTQYDDLRDEANDPADFEQYRVLSMRAVAAITLGIISVPALILRGLLPVALVGTLVGLNAVWAIRSARSELTGFKLAWSGLLMSAVSLIVGLASWGIEYATEVPDGYRRISFVDLQPDEKRPDLPVSPTSLELDGQRVFIKGYVYPSDKQSDLKQFVLVPDRGTCCFGGNPKLTDMIEVTLKDPLRVRYSFRMRSLGGILRVDETIKPVSGLGGVYYQLEADYVK